MANEIFVGNGGYATINDAVAAAQPFDTIRVEPGVYNETVIINKPLQLFGARAGINASKRKFTAENESIVTGNSIFAIFYVQADYVVIDGFTIQGNTQGPGIYTESTHSGYRIVNNRIQNNVFGIYLNTNGTVFSVVSQNFIQNNNQPGSASGNGIYTDQGSSAVFINKNRFFGHQNASIVFAGSTNQHNIVIANNKMDKDNSIALFNTETVLIFENRMNKTSGSAIFLGGGTKGIEIQSNDLLNGVSNGIRVTNVTGSANENIRATNNNIQGNNTAGLNISPGSYLAGPEPVNRRLDATNNWWGDESGPSPIGNGDLIIDPPPSVSDYVPFLRKKAK